MSGSLRNWQAVIHRGQYWIAGGVMLLTLSSGLAQGQVPATGLTTSPSAETVTRSLLRLGSRGAEVGELQATLKLLGFYTGAVDGVYGKDTIAAVIQFQQAAGLVPDGVTGRATWDRLFPPSEALPPMASQPSQPAPSPIAPDPKPAASNPDSVTFPILRQGMKGSAVVGLQERLRANGFLKGSADGVFGAETLAAVKAAQRNFGLEPDGVVGAATWNALLSRSR
jgi:N-acetylmuramoyl-L-alanine amidase